MPFDFVDLHIDWIRVCVFFCEVSISEAKLVFVVAICCCMMDSLGWEISPIQFSRLRDEGAHASELLGWGKISSK